MIIKPSLNHSPMHSVCIGEQPFFIKRDDLLNHHFSGNKARKLAYFLEKDFDNINTIVGHGSVQANSLYSLAALAQLKGWQLNFYTNRIPAWLKENPIGNYAGALKLGANIIEVDKLDTNLDTYMRKLAKNLPEESVFVPEGGRCQLAKQGIKQLAEEILFFCQQKALVNPKIMLPSGTGTTALFLQSFLPFEVLTCACVGGDEYLKTQFSELEENTSLWPTILPTQKKYHFGKLYAEFYQQWQQLYAETEIEFDLLYDPLGWITLLNYQKEQAQNSAIIYIHQGGIVGNESMLPRYLRKYSSIVSS